MPILCLGYRACCEACTNGVNSEAVCDVMSERRLQTLCALPPLPIVAFNLSFHTLIPRLDTDLVFRFLFASGHEHQGHINHEMTPLS